MKLLFFFLGFDRVFVFSISVLFWLKLTINTKESIDKAPVVQGLDNAIQRISVGKINQAIRWIVIYLVDSVIQHLNNRGLMFPSTLSRETSALSGKQNWLFPSETYIKCIMLSSH